ncbi:MAG: hypothetical protein FWC01_06485 [Treponema sp.]|nr:hypothetical protein [Treponema sp.]MCL2237474.1 hypothetical protein [Treponema sp.]
MKKLLVLLLTMILAAGIAFAQEAEAAPAQQAQEPAAEEPAPRQIERMSMEVTIGFPVHWTHGTHDNSFYPGHPGTIDQIIPMEDRFATANTAIGVALNFNFNRVAAFVLEADFFYGTKMHGFANPTADYISLSSANIFLGPQFYLYNNNTFRVPLFIGVHMFYFGDDVWIPELGSQVDPATGATSPGTIDGHWMNRTELQFGLGLALGFQYHFNSDIYIFSRVNVAIDFVRLHMLEAVINREPGRTDLDPVDYRKVEHWDFNNIHWTIKPTIGIGMKLN